MQSPRANAISATTVSAAGSWLSGSSFAFIQGYGVSPRTFGLIFGCAIVLFTGCNLMNARFERADLTDADLRGANLHQVETWRAKTTHVDLSGATVTGSKLARS